MDFLNPFRLNSRARLPLAPRSRCGGRPSTRRGAAAASSGDLPAMATSTARRHPRKVAQPGPPPHLGDASISGNEQFVHLPMHASVWQRWQRPSFSPRVTPAAERQSLSQGVNEKNCGSRCPEVLAETSALEGRVIRVRGRLGVGQISSTLKGCGQEAGQRRCCNSAGGEVIVSDGAEAIRIDGLYCRGDDSRSCCNAPAYGQEVVISGTLLRDTTDYNASDESGWHLANANVCNIDAR